MNPRKLKIGLSIRMFKTVRMLVRLVGFLILLLVCSFIFLRLYGVPKPVLQKILHRANTAGISVDIERVTLSLRGWRAENVRYYSNHSDDLEPLFRAKEALFIRRVKLLDDISHGWNFDIEALGIRLSPSVEWGIGIPSDSEFRDIEQATLSLGFFSDRIEMTKGTLFWMGATFHVNGTIIKSSRVVKKASSQATKESASGKRQKTILPTYVSEQQFLTLEKYFKVTRLNGGADIGIIFSVDMNDYASSRVDFNFISSDISYRDVSFSRAEIKGYYHNSRLVIEDAELIQDGQSVYLAGNFNFETGTIQGELINNITSKKLLLLLPHKVLDLLVKEELKFECLPKLMLKFDPARSKELLNHLSGSFSIQNIFYRNLEIESLEGLISRTDNRLELTKLRGTAVGQEQDASIVGSCLSGGSATGSVFWDANSEEFGVSATGSMDPSLFRDVLSIVPIATNVIGRFKFMNQPPQISLQLGAKYTDWSSFFINIQGRANDLKCHDAFLSSLNTAAYYKHGILRLDPIAAMHGSNFFKGMASLDFINSTATFDASGSMQPQRIEDAVYPEFNFFGNKIKTVGSTKIKAAGTLDWGSMAKTDFSSEVEAERVEIPIAAMDSFSAQVTGVGPLISVSGASFDFYDGHGESEFSIWLDPVKNEMPYELDVKLVDSDFQKLLRFLNAEVNSGISGLLSGNVILDADMSEDFFETANGKGQISIREGQLADLPLFNRFSRIIRKVVPGFNVFSITSLSGTFELKNGVIISDDAYFDGDVVSAKGQGSYSKQTGFNALVQAQMLSENPVSKVIRVITDPIFKLFELKLEGSLANPSWKLENFRSRTKDEHTEED